MTQLKKSLWGGILSHPDFWSPRELGGGKRGEITKGRLRGEVGQPGERKSRSIKFIRREAGVEENRKGRNRGRDSATHRGLEKIGPGLVGNNAGGEKRDGSPPGDNGSQGGGVLPPSKRTGVLSERQAGGRLLPFWGQRKVQSQRRNLEY